MCVCDVVCRMVWVCAMGEWELSTSIMKDYFHHLLQVLLSKEATLPSLLLHILKQHQHSQQQEGEEEAEDQSLISHLCVVLSHCFCQPQALCRLFQESRGQWYGQTISHHYVSRSKCELITSCSSPQDNGGRRSGAGQSIHTT